MEHIEEQNSFCCETQNLHEMAYVNYHSQSAAYQKQVFFRRKNLWVKRGDCRWIPASQDTDKRGKRYILNRGMVRIGDCQWEAVPARLFTPEAKIQIWQNYPKMDYPPVRDALFEARMAALPPKLQTPVILEAMAPNMEDVS